MQSTANRANIRSLQNSKYEMPASLLPTTLSSSCKTSITAGPLVRRHRRAGSTSWSVKYAALLTSRLDKKPPSDSASSSAVNRPAISSALLSSSSSSSSWVGLFVCSSTHRDIHNALRK